MAHKNTPKLNSSELTPEQLTSKEFRRGFTDGRMLKWLQSDLERVAGKLLPNEECLTHIRHLENLPMREVAARFFDSHKTVPGPLRLQAILEGGAK